MNRTNTKKIDDAKSVPNAQLERVAARIAARVYGGVWRPKTPSTVGMAS